MTDTLRERVRERLAEIIDPFALRPEQCEHFETEAARGSALKHWNFALDKADAILREFRLQPVSSGKVDAETREVDLTQ